MQVIGRWPNYIFSIKLAKTLYVEFTNTEWPAILHAKLESECTVVVSSVQLSSSLYHWIRQISVTRQHPSQKASKRWKCRFSRSEEDVFREKILEIYSWLNLAVRPTFSVKGISVSGGFSVFWSAVVYTQPPSQEPAPLLLTSQADSGGYGRAAQTHQALTDETCSPQWQGTLEMSPIAYLMVNTSTQSHPPHAPFDC